MHFSRAPFGIFFRTGRLFCLMIFKRDDALKEEALFKTGVLKTLVGGATLEGGNSLLGSGTSSGLVGKLLHLPSLEG